jgi:hypothetical protein
MSNPPNSYLRIIPHVSSGQDQLVDTGNSVGEAFKNYMQSYTTNG